MDATERDTRLKKLLAELETVKGVWEFDLASRVYALIGEDAGFEGDLAWRAEVLAFRFREASRIQDGEEGSHYLPVTGEKDTSEITEAIVEYWLRRASETSNALLKARYTGLAWEFGKVKLHMPIDHKVAMEQVEALLDIAKADLHHEHTNIIDKLLLALTVACTLNKGDLIRKCKAAMFDYEARVGEDKFPGLWGFCFDALIHNKKAALTDQETATLLAELEARLERLVRVEGERIPDHWSAEQAASRLADYYRGKGDLDNMRRIVRALGGAYDVAASKAAPLLASAWLERMHSIYESYGLQKEAEETLKQIRALAPGVLQSMKRIEHQVEIPQDQYEALLQRMIEGGLEKALPRLTARFIPKQNSVREFLAEATAAAPLTSLLTKQLITHDGHVTAVLGSVDEDIDGNVVQGMSRLMQFEIPFLANVVTKLQETYGLNSSSMLDYLFKSPVYKDERRAFLERGLEAYFSEDYMSAIHVLVPQIEELVRHLLEKCGGSVLRSNRNGGYDLRVLDDLLRDRLIIKALGEDLAIYLRVLLCDRRGWNIRNNTCHGMLGFEEVGRPIADRVVHSLICLAMIREKRHEAKLVAKVPAQCTPEELSAFRELVEQGDEVQVAGLQDRIADAAKLVILYVDGITQGTSALKLPGDGYRDAIFEKAGVKEKAHRFRHELGWIFIAVKARGNHYSRDLAQTALSGSEGLPVFATTAETNNFMQKTLDRLGFERAGKPYSGRGGRKLVLYVRAQQT